MTRRWRRPRKLSVVRLRPAIGSGATSGLPFHLKQPYVFVGEIPTYERAAEQTDAADEARPEWSFAADLCVRRTNHAENVRTLLRAYAVAFLVTGSLAAIAGGHSLLAGAALGHRYTLAQYTLFWILVASGVLGCVGGLLLLRFHRAGLWTAELYLVLVLALCALAEHGVVRTGVQLVAGAAIVALATPAARRSCRSRFLTTAVEST
jgi:hypothetical protein